MARMKRKKIISIVILSICIIIGIIVLVCFKLKNNYIFKISDAFFKTINATSIDFKLEYKNNKDELNVIGSLEYNYKDLEALMSGTCNGGKVVANISMEESTIAYFIDTFNYWLKLDITESTAKILNKIKNIGVKSVEENFPVQEILKLTIVDEKIDISKYPNRFSKKFILKFVNNNFKNDVLRFTEERKNENVIYSVTPNVYELLMEFIECSDLEDDEKEIHKAELEKNKKILGNVKLVLSVIINEDGYIEEFFYSEIENENVKEINLKLKNVNNAKVELEEGAFNKLMEK